MTQQVLEGLIIFSPFRWLQQFLFFFYHTGNILTIFLTKEKRLSFLLTPLFLHFYIL
jgi:hypothetical protein